MELQVDGQRVNLSTFEANQLAKNVLNSLFSWRRADPSDAVQAEDSEGWWGDTYADVPGDEFGSRLWELLRQKVTAQTLRQAEEYAREALQYLIDDGVARSVSVSAESTEPGRVDLLVVLYKPDQSQIAIRFQNVWESV